MRSLILQTISRGVLPVAVLFSLYLLLRGHDEPGGGFIAGLVTAAAIVLQALAFGVAVTREALRRHLRWAMPVGLVLAASTGLISVVLWEQPYMSHRHAHVRVPGSDSYVHLATTLLFDLGVYFVVVGVASSLLSEFAGDP